MAKVLIEEWIWDAVCERYANIPKEEQSAVDQEVLLYMKDKLLRQTDRQIYWLNLQERGNSYVNYEDQQ